MNNEVKSIELVLENCECINIERKYIGSFWCDEITESIDRIACNSIRKQQHCNEFFIEIYRDANSKYDCFGSESIDTSFDRLISWPDITHISIKYKNGKEDYIALPWEDTDENGCSNKYQTSYVSKCGDMYICVCKGKSVSDLIDLELVNDKESADIYWEFFMEN